MTTADALRRLRQKGRGARTQKAPQVADSRPLGLVFRPRLVKRDDFLVLCVRSWPAAGRSRAVERVREAKREMDAGVIELAASEVAGVIRSTFGKLEGGVVLPPRGASKTEKHFGTEIARLVAERCGLPVAGQATYVKTEGNNRFHGQKAVSSVRWDCPCSLSIVIDDVYTTGATLSGIRKTVSGACLLVAWIGPGGRSEQE